jgi:hypothetical protein
MVLVLLKKINQLWSLDRIQLNPLPFDIPFSTMEFTTSYIADVCSALRTREPGHDMAVIESFHSHLAQIPKDRRVAVLQPVVENHPLLAALTDTLRPTDDPVASCLSIQCLFEMIRSQAFGNRRILSKLPNLLEQAVSCLANSGNIPLHQATCEFLAYCFYPFPLDQSAILQKSLLPSIATILRQQMQFTSVVDWNVPNVVVLLKFLFGKATRGLISKDYLLSDEFNFFPQLAEITAMQPISAYSHAVVADLFGIFWNAAENGTPDAAHYLLNSSVTPALLCVLEQVGPDPVSWPQSITKCMNYFMNLARHPFAAQALKITQLPRIVQNIQSSDKHCEDIKAAFICAFMYGRDETLRGGQALLQQQPELLAEIVDVFQTMLEGKDEHPQFKRGTFCFEVVLAGLLALSVSDGNKNALVQSAIPQLAARTLDIFVRNQPAISGCGGGGQDPIAASLAIEILLHLSFQFTEEDLRSVYVAQLGLEHMLSASLQQLSGRADLSPDGMKLAHTLLGRLQARASQPERPVPNRAHIMVSYAWAARKDLVTALVSDLRGRGYDMWRDEDGSALVSFMCGATDDIMAEVCLKLNSPVFLSRSSVFVKRILFFHFIRR